MSEFRRKYRFQKKLDAQLESPIPLLSRLKNLIFGKENPDYYTQISFYIGLIIWLIFLVWTILGYTVLTNTEWIETEKGIEVQKMIAERGIALGFEGDTFQHALITFYTIALFCWAGMFVGLVLQWRKQPQFIYFIGGFAIIYLVSMWILLSFSYWYTDTTTFDKIAFFVFLGHSALFYFLLQRERQGEPLNFFGISEDEEDED